MLYWNWDLLRCCCHTNDCTWTKIPILRKDSELKTKMLFFSTFPIHIVQGWPNFFARGPNLKIIFSSGAAPFKISFNFCKAILMLIEKMYFFTVFVQICLNRLLKFAFTSSKKRLKATLWSCLIWYSRWHSSNVTI